MKYGVILARFQPVHKGHIALINKACNENDKVLLLVGSADKFNERNPIPLNYRVDMLKQALIDCNLINKCIIKPFNDLTSESDNSIEWGFYLYANVVDIINQSDFTIYYSDGYEIITTWFPGYILREFVSLSLLARSKVENGISATKVRKAIMTGDPELEKMAPESVFENRATLKTFIELSKNK